MLLGTPRHRQPRALPSTYLRLSPGGEAGIQVLLDRPLSVAPQLACPLSLQDAMLPLLSSRIRTRTSGGHAPLKALGHASTQASVPWGLSHDPSRRSSSPWHPRVLPLTAPWSAMWRDRCRDYRRIRKKIFSYGPTAPSHSLALSSALKSAHSAPTTSPPYVGVSYRRTVPSKPRCGLLPTLEATTMLTRAQGSKAEDSGRNIATPSLCTTNAPAKPARRHT